MVAHLLTLTGCLPPGALSREDDLAALRYHVEVGVSAAEGFGLPAWSWTAGGEAVMGWSRTFRDGTIGHSVRFEGMVDDVGAPVWDQAVIELRTFPSGEIVAIEGLAPWSGTAGHLELADLLWPALSPRVPDAPRGEAVTGTAAWPVLFPAGPGPRLRMEGSWTLRDHEVVWGGTLSGESGRVRLDGRVDGRYTRTDDRVTAAQVDSARTVTTRWAAGAQHVQAVVSSVSVSLLGEVPAAPLAPRAAATADADPDALPLVFADGRAVVPGPASDAHLPFLAVSASTAERIRGTLAPTVPSK